MIVLGNLLVEHVSYDTLVHAGDGTTQYTMDPLDATIPATARLSTDKTEGYKTLDVTAAVLADLAASRSRAQFRLRFEKEGVEDESEIHISYLTSWAPGEKETNQPELVIKYKPAQ